MIEIFLCVRQGCSNRGSSPTLASAGESTRRRQGIDCMHKNKMEWSLKLELNRRPAVYETAALSTELFRRHRLPITRVESRRPDDVQSRSTEFD